MAFSLLPLMTCKSRLSATLTGPPVHLSRHKTQCYWLLRVPGELLDFLEIKKAKHCIQILFRGRIPSLGHYHLWNTVAQLPSPRLPCSTHWPSCTLLRQPVCQTNSSQSYFPWAHKTYWSWLPCRPRKTPEETLPLAADSLRWSTRWYFHKSFPSNLF